MMERNENNRILLNYDFKEFTTEEIPTGPIPEGNVPPMQPRQTRSIIQSDPEAMAMLKRANLLDEQGNIDLKALFALPSCDGPDTPPPTTRAPVPGSDLQLVNDPTVLPYCWSTYLAVEYPGVESGKFAYSRGTGFVVGHNAIATAGHVLYNHNAGSWDPAATGPASAIVVIYNLQSDGAKVAGTSATRLRVPQTYKTDPKIQNDWGILEIKDDISTITGWCGIQNVNINVVEQVGRINGYPLLTNEDETIDYAVMVTATGKIIRQEDTSEGSILHYKISTRQGNSGSPVLVNNQYAVAIHSLGSEYQSDPSKNFNSGRRVDSLVYQTFLSYRN